MLFVRGQWSESVEDQHIAVFVIEGVKARYPLQRILRMQVLERARVNLIPRRIPAWLIGVDAVGGDRTCRSRRI